MIIHWHTERSKMHVYSYMIIIMNENVRMKFSMPNNNLHEHQAHLQSLFHVARLLFSPSLVQGTYATVIMPTFNLHVSNACRKILS